MLGPEGKRGEAGSLSSAKNTADTSTEIPKQAQAELLAQPQASGSGERCKECAAAFTIGVSRPSFWCAN